MLFRSTSADVEDVVETAVVPTLRVLNKSDLLDHTQPQPAGLRVSGKTGKGMPILLAELEKLVREKFGGMEQASVVRTRHRDAIEESIRYLNDSLLYNADRIELAAECLRKACFSIARVTGRVDVEDLLDKIFSEFCIGK